MDLLDHLRQRSDLGFPSHADALREVGIRVEGPTTEPVVKIHDPARLEGPGDV
jgi:hypothetical protein